jgi:hypothetical protein
MTASSFSAPAYAIVVPGSYASRWSEPLLLRETGFLLYLLIPLGTLADF